MKFDALKSTNNLSSFSIKFHDRKIEDIAIIGMGLNFPQSPTKDIFWEHLCAGEDLTTTFPISRKKMMEPYLKYAGFPDEMCEYLPGAYLEEIDTFDHAFFHVTPNEAGFMDPTQRLFLQCAYTAMEDAGYGGNRLSGSRMGIYIGYEADVPFDYKRLLLEINSNLPSLAVTGNLTSIIASRLSYLFNLHGPALSVDTACSSSLVAVHLACRALLQGDCDVAMAGGVRLHLLPITKYSLNLGTQSIDGKTRTFSEEANGTVSGEGVAVIILKSLTKAIRDRDLIYAVIKGGAVNHDGHSIGVTAPNPAAQEDVIVSAWKNAGIDPRTVSYIEAHGTGTTLGDPIEIEGITRAFRRFTKDTQFCAIGSVKSNVGHMDNAAGMAGLIKCILALQHRTIPPTLYFNKPNSKIDFINSPVYVNSRLRYWETVDGSRTCGVSSFGFAGTNCHVVLQEYNSKPMSIEKNTDAFIVTLSAHSLSTLKDLINDYREYMITCVDIHPEDIGFTTCVGRGHYAYRIAFVADSFEELQQKIYLLDTWDWKKLKDVGIGIYFSQTNFSEDAVDDIKNESFARPNIHSLNMEAEKLMTGLLTPYDLEYLCSVYVQGAEISWEKFYEKRNCRIVSLPTYPFRKDHHWVNIPRQTRRQSNTQTRNDRYLTTCWEECTSEKTIGDHPETVLFIVGNHNQAYDMINEFQRHGHIVFLAKCGGNTFYRKTETEFILQDEYDSFYKLAAVLSNILIHRIIVVSDNQGVINDNSEINDMSYRKFQQKSIDRLYYINKVFSVGRISVKLILVVQNAQIVDGTESSLHPEHIQIQNLGKTIGMENPGWISKTIDIGTGLSIHTIYEEIMSPVQPETVAYRQGRRYVEKITSINPTPYIKSPIGIKEGGVYLLTGGLGGLGLAFASRLSTARTKLILVGRMGLPEREKWEQILKSEEDAVMCRKIRTIQECEKNGAEVLICCADVADYQAMNQVIKEILSRFGALHGVFHMAGVGVGQTGSLLWSSDKSIFDEVSRAKVLGCCVLGALTASISLDFFVLFSSPITYLGGKGTLSYASANAFLDAYADYLNHSGRYALSIGWAPWEETVKSMGDTFVPEKQLFHVLSTSEILDGFMQMLGCRSSRVTVGLLNYSSELFHLKDQLPFHLTKQLSDKLEEVIGMPHRTTNVNMTGRKINEYSLLEKEIGSVFGKILGFDQINIHDNYFELGGDSIYAAKIIAVINQCYQTNLTIADLLQHPIFEDFVEQVTKCIGLEQQELVSTSGMEKIPLAPIAKNYPLSSEQKRIFLIEMMDMVEWAYHVPAVIILHGKIDQMKIKRILKSMVQRHEILRTTFMQYHGAPVQNIHTDGIVDFQFNELGEHTLEMYFEKWMKPFSLDKLPLFRVALVSMGDKREYALLMDLHHMITDGVSANIFLNEFMALYADQQLPNTVYQYKDYATWQDSLLTQTDSSVNADYWRSVFRDLPEPLQLPYDYVRPARKSFKGEMIEWKLESQLSDDVYQLAESNAVSLFVLMMTFYYILLSKYSNQTDIVIGTPVHNRPTGFDQTMGIFLNTLPLRISCNTSMTFVDLLTRVNQIWLEALKHMDYPFDQLIKDLRLNASLNRNLLFDTMLIVQNIQTEPKKIDQLTAKPYHMPLHAAKFDMKLEIFTETEGLRFTLDYSTALFQRSTIEGMCRSFDKIIKTVIQNENIKLCNIHLADDMLSQSITDLFIAP